MTKNIQNKLTALIAGSLTFALAANLSFAETSAQEETTPSAQAATLSPAQGLIDNRFVVEAGAYLVGTDVKVSLNGNAANDQEIDLNNQLDKPSDATRSRLDALWRINPRHHVRFLYFNNDVTRSKTLTQDINWGDYTFLSGSYVESQSKLTVYELAYEYAFMHEPDYEVAASAGVHYMDMSLQFSGNADYTPPGGPTTSVGFTSKSSNLPAPLPLIGVRGGWVVAPNWYLDAQAQFLKIGYEGYKGYWSDLRAGATWMFSKHFGVGAGYNVFALNVDVSRPNFDGKIKMGYSGFQAFLTGTY